MSILHIVITCHNHRSDGIQYTDMKKSPQPEQFATLHVTDGVGGWAKATYSLAVLYKGAREQHQQQQYLSNEFVSISH